jgi:dTDP-4-dehydrorhamnose reductase
MRWAVIGDTGLFGSELAHLLEERGEKVYRFNRSNLDLEQSAETLSKIIGQADLIVNAVGYTEVDKAEQEPHEANTVNAIYAGKLADVSVMVGAKYFYLSTDYVFDGNSDTPYSVSAGTNAQSVYGKSKELGEQLISQSGAVFSIFRTSWLYGARGKNFAKTIASKFKNLEAVNVVSDQIGVPTWTRDVAEVVYQHGVEGFNEKIVHAVASGFGSWFEFAREVVSSMPNTEPYVLSPVSTDQMTTAAKRPTFSVLDNSETRGPVIGDWRSRWRIAAQDVLAEFLTN